MPKIFRQPCSERTVGIGQVIWYSQPIRVQWTSICIQRHVMVTDTYDVGAINDLVGGDGVIMEAGLVRRGAAFLNEGTVGWLVESTQGPSLIDQAVVRYDVICIGRIKPATAIKIRIVTVRQICARN